MAARPASAMPAAEENDDLWNMMELYLIGDRPASYSARLVTERLYIVDGHGYIFRAHYGLMNISRGERKEVRLSTAEGMPTGALYVFSRMLLRPEEDNQPKRIAVVFDDKSGRKTFRPEMYAEYKAHRKETPEELQVQMEYFAKSVRGLGWPCIAVPGVEADDTIASLVEKAKAKGWEVVMYSADKDMMQ